MRRTLVIILSVWMAGNAWGQVLYRVNGSSLKGESYILFVDQMLSTGSLIGVKDVFRCYNRSETVLCEYVEDGSIDKWEEMIQSSSHLSSTIRVEEIGLVDSVLKADCDIRLSQVERLKPAVVRMMWEAEVCRSQFEREEDDMAMESYFQQVALIEGRNIVVLDDSVRAFRHLDENLEEQGRKMVEAFRHGRDSIVARYHKADSLYRVRDVRGLAEMQLEGMQEKTAEAEIRGKVDGWTGKIVENMRERRCFLIIQAKYVKGGLIEKLKKQGLIIKEVK